MHASDMDGPRQRHDWGAAHRAALLRAVVDVLPEFPAIAAVYLYGSARFDDPVGDVDIGLIQVPGTDALSAGDVGQLERRIQEAGGLPFPPLDLRRLTADQFLFVHSVLRTGQLVYERDSDARVAVEVDAERRYLDTAWLRTFYQAFRQRLANAP